MKEYKLLTKKGVINCKINEHKSGLYWREGSCDLLTISECLRNYKNVQVKDKIVLDLGSNIGAFTNMALKGGAKKVISVEPDFYNYEMLIKNTENFSNLEIFNAAISNKDEHYLDFYIGKGKGGPSMASLTPTKGRLSRKVKNLYAPDFFGKINPDVIKLDIEGGEYDIIEFIPHSCREITLEWHAITPNQKKLYAYWYPIFMKSGWKIVYEKKREFFSDPKYHGGIENFIKRTGGVPQFVVDAHYRR